MFNNVALDVFIGLIFVFLLYGLLATIIMEFIAHSMALRARLLVKALRRMLEDNPREIFGRKFNLTIVDVFTDAVEFIKRYFRPFKDLPFLTRFYSHPTIKYLGESKSSSKPSYMEANNFSQTMIQILRGENYSLNKDQMTAIHDFLFVTAQDISNQYEAQKHWILNLPILNKFLPEKSLTINSAHDTAEADTNTDVKEITPQELAEKLKKMADSMTTRKPTAELLLQLSADIKAMNSIEEVQTHVNSLSDLLKRIPQKISPDTLKHLQNLFNDAQFDFERFKDRLEEWFNETMDRASGWYKRQTQIILLLLGLGIAIIANVNTIGIYKILSTDKKARDQIVNLAIQSKGNYSVVVEHIRNKQKDSTKPANLGDTSTSLRFDTLRTGDSVLDNTYSMLQKDVNSAESILGLGWCTSDSCKKYEHDLDSLKALSDTSTALKIAIVENRKKYHAFKNDWTFWSLVGWLITALAISLGAPFWFDLLNKLVNLRSAGAKVTTQPQADSKTTSAPLSVTVNANSPNNTEEAVG